MSVKGKEIKKEVKLVALKEPIQVPYNGNVYDGNVYEIKRITLPKTHTTSRIPFISISHIGDINPTTQNVTVVTDYGDVWVIPVTNITNIVYGTSELEENMSEIKTEESLSSIAHIEGKDTNSISGKGEVGPNLPKFIKRQDRLYPTEPINAYEFFKNNQEQLSHGNYPFNAGIYKSTLRRNDRATHAFVLNNAHMDVNELEQAFLAPISLHELTYKKLLYVTQDDKGNYEMIMDTATEWDNPNYRDLDPKLFK